METMRQATNEPPITMRQLLEAGVHFGHQTKRWNPKMRPFIFGARNGIHIIDLQHTVKLFNKAYNFIVNTVAQGEAVLFVGTKKQAQEVIQEEAKRAGQEVTEVPHAKMAPVIDLMEALKKSIAEKAPAAKKPPVRAVSAGAGREERAGQAPAKRKRSAG